MSTPLSSDEIATQASKSALRPRIDNPSNADYLDSSDFPEGGVTAWSTVLGAYVFLNAYRCILIIYCQAF
jgi:hypothetical protein